MKTVNLHNIRAEVAATFFERARGLIGHRPLAADEGMLILKCNCIHTFFMRFPIDATFLDADDRVVRVVRNIPPGRLWVWGGWRARKVLETAASSAEVTR